MEFNDGSQYRVVTDPARHMAERQMFEFRVASAKNGVRPYVDTAFDHHREKLGGMRALLMYQFPYQNAGTPEYQARFFMNALGAELRPNEMVMLDTEGASALANPVDFTRRWFAAVEAELNTRAWLYVPNDLSKTLTRAVTGTRLVKAPRYSGTAKRATPPSWPHDVHQYTDRGYFPGCTQTGDVNYTTLTVDDMLARCRVTPRITANGDPMELTLPAVTVDDPGKPPGFTGTFGHLVVIAVPPGATGIRIACGWAPLELLDLAMIHTTQSWKRIAPARLDAAKLHEYTIPPGTHQIEIRYTSPFVAGLTLY